MARNEQGSTAESTAVGGLITWPRRYNLLTDVFFLGRTGRLIAELADAGGVRSGDHAVDIGCGPGRLVRELSTRVGPHGRVVGIDPSAPMIDYATAHSPANCRFELAPAQSLTQPDAAFDVATCTFAMHHIPEAERERALRQIFRILRPGGRLLLADATPTSGFSSAAIRFMARVSARRHGRGGAAHSHHAHDEVHGHDYSANANDPLATVNVQRYRKVLSDIGFTDFEYRTSRFPVGILTAVKPA
ncbi:methyltransferase domain-containing protein [Nocardia yamanashiensis]|uniref:class I SAM-dependent methyltransferase n=1 Tax=Nocardia yamanashiensis TaxID=209247 RepID=UPI001E4D00F0|nr:class I SAM-dependent methyltransferase [Nocardia yamanashiensis]UGT39435.1 methyltransferase domain-containing protein [Nocardia yamanashiensis]